MVKTLIVMVLGISVSWAKPNALEGTWTKLQEIQPVALIKYAYVVSVAEENELKSHGYICQKVGPRKLCKKLITKNFTLPENVQDQFHANSPKRVHFHKAFGGFTQVTDGDSVKEWTLTQSTDADDLRYHQTLWRESKGTYARVVLSSSEHSQKLELLILGNGKLGRQIMDRFQTKNGWSEYWGQVNYN